MGLLTVCVSDTHRMVPCTAMALALIGNTSTLNFCSWTGRPNKSTLGVTVTSTAPPPGMSTSGRYIFTASTKTFFTVRSTTTGANGFNPDLNVTKMDA